jgi:hypothetical protein
LVDFLEKLFEKNSEQARTALYPLFAFFPLNTDKPLQVIIPFLVRVAKRNGALRGFIADALTVAIEGSFFDSLGPDLPWTAAEVSKSKNKLPSSLFQTERAPEPFGISQAVERFKAIVKEFPELEEINRSAVGLVPRATKSFQDWAKQVLVDPGIIL